MHLDITDGKLVQLVLDRWKAMSKQAAIDSLRAAVAECEDTKVA